MEKDKELVANTMHIPLLVEMGSMESDNDSVIIANTPSHVNGDIICFKPNSLEYEASAEQFDKVYAERIITLWNAFDGLTNDQVIIAANMYKIILKENK